MTKTAEMGMRMAALMTHAQLVMRDLVRTDAALVPDPTAPEATKRLRAEMMIHAKGLLAALDAISAHYMPRADA